MPSVRQGESEDDYVKRCIPVVIAEGTAKDGGQAAAICHSMYKQKKRQNNNALRVDLSIVQNSAYTVRTEIHAGQRHLVVPVIMMVEGVHNGSHGPMLHLAEELGRFPESWNGIPVTIHHPEDSGHPISANSPDVIDHQTVGRVYNARVENGKLKAEAWINESSITQISANTLAMIRQAQPIEVSIGAFTEDEIIEGDFNNEHYVAIARNHRPDHLALLPGAQGACSWQDGCGIRANVEFEPPEAGDAPTAVKKILKDVYSTCRSTWIKDHPNDRENAANKTSCARIAWHAVEQAGWHKRGSEWIKTNQEGGENVVDIKQLKELPSSGFIALQINQQGYREVMQAIQTKLDRMDDDVKVHFLVDVFDNSFIYEVRGRAMGMESAMYRRSYSVDASGAVEFTGEPTSVRRKVEYVNSNSIQENKEAVTDMADEQKKKPCCPGKVDLLIQSKHYSEQDREWLNLLEEPQINKIIDVETLLTQSQSKADSKPTKEQAVTILREAKLTSEQFLEILPSNLRDSMQTGLNLNDEMRADLITKITAYSKSYSEAELKAMSTDQLKKLASLIPQQNDFSGAGAGSGDPINANTSKENVLVAGDAGLEKTEGGQK